MNKPYEEMSFSEVIDLCAEKVLHKLIRGDLRDGVADAVHVVIAWQQAIRAKQQEAVDREQ